MRSLASMLVGIAIAASLPGIVVALPKDLLTGPSLKMSEADKNLQYEAVMAVLEGSDARATREWSNPSTGFSGRVEGRGDMTSSEGLSCRRLQLRAQGQGAQSQFTFPFCKDTKGEWFIASGKKFSDDAARR